MYVAHTLHTYIHHNLDQKHSVSILYCARDTISEQQTEKKTFLYIQKTLMKYDRLKY